ncbi:PrsW family intramembrane metalloprotease [Actinocorallia longicatena]|uniref:RsiW-degrading membrane proteinase PrsW (M82 family) n=1 Tax=Actinocorallia longicatena TaxID=111803 RepID=A0ABP6Q3D6_9ACTN
MSTATAGHPAREPADDLAAGRRLAIEASGWGEPFRIVQPRNACFWLLLWGLGIGATHLIRYFAVGVGAYGTGLGIGIVAFTLYTIPWLFLLGHHNRYTSLPPKLFAVAFAWGALASAFWMALPANTAILSLYGKNFGYGWAGDWGAGLTAPFTEETAKATALVLLIGLAPRVVRSPYDGLMIGAFAGLGFQIFEDVLYAYNNAATGFGLDQAATAWKIVAVRGLAGLTGHVLFSAVFCAGLMWLLGRGGPGHRLRGLLFVVAALFLHGGWDDAAALGTVLFGEAGPVILMGLMVVVDLAVLWLAFRLAAPQEKAWIRAILAPETASGLLTDTEVRAASGDREARRAHLKAQPDRRHRRTARHVLASADDLAKELALSGGEDSPDVLHAREETARLRALA